MSFLQMKLPLLDLEIGDLDEYFRIKRRKFTMRTMICIINSLMSDLNREARRMLIANRPQNFLA